MTSEDRITVAQLNGEIELIGAFHCWLQDFSAVDDSDLLLRRLLDSTSQLPKETAQKLGRSAASTYADAARLFLDRWA